MFHCNRQCSQAPGKKLCFCQPIQIQQLPGQHQRLASWRGAEIEDRLAGLRIDRQQPVKIGDLSAFRAEGRARSAAIHLTWIAREGAIVRWVRAQVSGRPTAIR